MVGVEADNFAYSKKHTVTETEFPQTQRNTTQ